VWLLGLFLVVLGLEKNSANVLQRREVGIWAITSFCLEVWGETENKKETEE
jgi:hypothetical protein